MMNQWTINYIWKPSLTILQEPMHLRSAIKRTSIRNSPRAGGCPHKPFAHIRPMSCSLVAWPGQSNASALSTPLNWCISLWVSTAIPVFVFSANPSFVCFSPTMRKCMTCFVNFWQWNMMRSAILVLTNSSEMRVWFCPLRLLRHLGTKWGQLAAPFVR